MYNAILRHGHVADILLKGTITHIPKDPKGKLSDSGNYRGICLCISLCKVLEDLIMTKHYGFFITSELQMAYKKKLSTNFPRDFNGGLDTIYPK